MRETDVETTLTAESVRTNRLLLRPSDEADRQTLAGLSAAPGIRQNLATTPGDRDGGATFVLVSRRTGAPIGACAVGPLADRPAAAEIATWIGEEHWGNGFATEATHALIDRVFAGRKVAVLWCATRVANPRARRVIEKCGFQFRETGMARSPFLHAALPVERFALERRNWASLKSWGAGTNGDADGRRDHAA